MSMLGEQIKELREKADMLDGLEGMDNLVRILREAADTIEGLRDRLQATIETCHWEYTQGVNGWVGYIVCSACGHQFSGVDEREWTCCPCCRREIKEVDA